MTFTTLCWWKSSAANLHVNFDIWQWKALRAVMWCEHNKPVPVAVPGPGQYPLPLCSQCSEVCEVPQSQTGQKLIQTMRSEDLTQSDVCCGLFIDCLLWKSCEENYHNVSSIQYPDLEMMIVNELSIIEGLSRCYNAGYKICHFPLVFSVQF